MSTNGSHFFEFGPFRLDPVNKCLFRNGQIMSLTPKAFETLYLLVRNSGQVVAKDKMLKEIWPHSFVEEATLAQNIFTLRRILGEDPGGRHYIETFPKRGYRFAASVTRKSEADPEPRMARSLEHLSSVKSLAVLPFRALGLANQSEYFGMGIADALITKLSNVANIIVRPTSAILRYNQVDVEPTSAGKQMHVDLVLDGLIQKLGEKMRITVQLINTETGTLLWAERFDEDSSDVFTFQDKFSSEVVGALIQKLIHDENQGFAGTAH